MLNCPGLNQWHLLSAGADGGFDTKGPAAIGVALKRDPGYYYQKGADRTDKNSMISSVF